MVGGWEAAALSTAPGSVGCAGRDGSLLSAVSESRKREAAEADAYSFVGGRSASDGDA